MLILKMGYKVDHTSQVSTVICMEHSGLLDLVAVHIRYSNAHAPSLQCVGPEGSGS